MDKRYLLIIVILIMGCSTLYFITNASYSIGSATATLGNSIFSLPEGFSVDHSEKNYVSILNNDGVYMHINVVNGKKDDNYNGTLSYLSRKNIPIVSSGSINVKDIVVDSVFYNKTEHNSTSRSNDNVYGAFFIFNKQNRTFNIEVTHFDYADKNKIIHYAEHIVNSIDKNYLV